MPVVAINKQTGALEGVPEIITRGFVMEDSQALLADGARLLERGDRAGQRRRAHRSGADQGKAARRAAALLPQTFGPAAVRAAGHHGDLSRESIDRFAPRQRVRRRRAVRRRADLADRARQLRADRPGLVLQHRRRTPRRPTSPAASARSSPSCRFSCSATPSYLIPAVLVDRRLALLLVPAARRADTKATGAALLFACISAFLSLVLGTLDVVGQAVPRRRLRRRLARRRDCPST